MSLEALPFDPNQVPQLLKEGRMRVVKPGAGPITPTPITPDRPVNADRRAEKAKQLFGEDFLGEEAIHKMEEKFKAAGVDVIFNIPQVVFPLDERQLEAAKQEAQNGRARMVVLRPETMVVNGQRKPITLLGFRDLFKDHTNPFGSEKVFCGQTWYETEDFAKHPMEPGFGLPTKEVLRDSLNKNWNNQQSLLQPGEERREVIETVWDTVLYYAATGKKVLENHWDWGKTSSSDGLLVSVGNFDSGGLYVGRWGPANQAPDLGVCPSR